MLLELDCLLAARQQLHLESHGPAEDGDGHHEKITIEAHRGPLPDAFAHPWAVVVMALDADAADIAVCGASRLFTIALGAPPPLSRKAGPPWLAGRTRIRFYVDPRLAF